MITWCGTTMVFIPLLSILIGISPILHGAVRDAVGRGNTPYNDHSILRRLKRDAQCGYWPNEYECRDGTCIAADRKCDGTVDCPDGSDEKHYICRETECPDYLFRCTYGACVDGTAPCNGVSDCADNSDELQPKCSNNSSVIGDQFKCADGSLVELYRRCDGIRDCKDGSDETLNSCAANMCPSNLFQCAYGACVDEGVECNDVDDCADGSDESDVLCNRSVPRTTTTTTTTTTTPSTTTVEAPTMCVLPPHPKNGLFLKNGDSATYKPGETLPTVYLNITCMPGYKVEGEKVVICYGGLWYPYKLPTCVRACELLPSESVTYRCLMNSAGVEGTRDCEQLEAEGTAVQPECRRPNYYSPTVLPYMFCVDGRWSYEPKCQPECGTLTPRAYPLVAGGQVAARGEVPWHVGIYKLENGRYKYICGGTLVSENVIVSAAHCFWAEGYGQLPVGEFAVAVGKVFREWGDPRDIPYAQFSTIKQIVMSRYFGGADFLYQDDVAVLIVEKRFQFRTYVRPACLDFSPKFNEFQLQNGNIGKVAGMGQTSNQRGSESDELKVLDVHYVDWEDCKRLTPPEFRSFIVGGKICAGNSDGTGLRRGDSGGGLVFGARAQGVLRYYLRGVVSTNPHADGEADRSHGLTSFTALQPHEALVRAHLAP